MSSQNLIEEKHKEKVIIYNGYNGRSIERLRHTSEEDLQKKREFYDKFSYIIYFDGMKGFKENIWWKTSFLIAYALGGLTLFLLSDELNIKYLGIFIFICFLSLIIERKGHKSGYLDGYEIGIIEGVDKALCIDEEDKKMIKKEVEAAEQLDRELEHSAWLRERGL